MKQHNDWATHIKATMLHEQLVDRVKAFVDTTLKARDIGTPKAFITIPLFFTMIRERGLYRKLKAIVDAIYKGQDTEIKFNDGGIA